MAKQMVSLRLEEEVRDLLAELSRLSGKEFGTHLSQAQIVEKAVREFGERRTLKRQIEKEQ